MKKKKILKDKKKVVELKKVKGIIKLCRSMGVSELSVGSIQIRFFPTPSSLEYSNDKPENQPPKRIKQESKTPELTPKEKPDDTGDGRLDLLLIENPSAYMAAVENKELILGEDFSLDIGEEVS